MHWLILKTLIAQEKLAHRFIAFVNNIVHAARCAAKSILRLYPLSGRAAFNREERHSPKDLGLFLQFRRPRQTCGRGGRGAPG